MCEKLVGNEPAGRRDGGRPAGRVDRARADLKKLHFMKSPNFSAFVFRPRDPHKKHLRVKNMVESGINIVF